MGINAETERGCYFPVPEEPFDVPLRVWQAGVVLFTLALLAATVLVQQAHAPTMAIVSLYLIPAILFGYFFRRKGVIATYLVALFLFSVAVIFRYPSAGEILAAALDGILLIAVALVVSWLTSHLVTERRKYHAIFENTENGVALIGLPDQAIVEENQRFANALGLAGGEACGRGLSEFVVDRSSLSPLFTALEAHCRVPATEAVMRRGDGSEWAAVIAARKISPDHVVLTFIDITERRRLSDQLARCNADANLYLDILTHDINNINTAGIAYAQLLELQPPEERPALLRKLMRSLERSNEIIRNISILRKMQEAPAKKFPVPLAGIIKREIAAFPDAKISYDGQDAVVMANEMLSSIFANLIGNSLKYGGEDPRVEIGVRAGDREVEVTISDHGHGIPDTLKPLIFDRFQRGDESVSGRGLGLFICRSLVEQYGGWIRAEDRIAGDPSQGTVIRFVLPAARE